MKLRASCRLNKHFVTEPHLQPPLRKNNTEVLLSGTMKKDRQMDREREREREREEEEEGGGGGGGGRGGGDRKRSWYMMLFQ